eukprot:6492012-Amphidinium_carterae.2
MVSDSEAKLLQAGMFFQQYPAIVLQPVSLCSNSNRPVPYTTLPISQILSKLHYLADWII